LKLSGEGKYKKIYEINKKKILKIYKDPTAIHNFQNKRLNAERNLGRYLPKVYKITNKGYVEEHCGTTTIDSCFNSSTIRKEYLIFLIRAYVLHYPIDTYVKNFHIVDKQLKYVDWEIHGQTRIITFKLILILTVYLLLLYKIWGLLK
jgi:hypothetical protein